MCAMSAASAATVPLQPPSLWESLPLQVICGTGEFGTGKTLFGVTIDPGPRTLVFDNEGSSTVYQSLGFNHLDMAAEIRRWLRETKQNREPKPIDRWVWWRDRSIAEGKSGKFTVCMVDPFSEIEAGLADYVMEHPSEFGKTKAQFLNASGLFWGCVKDALKEHLDNLRTLYQTVYLTVHMREKFSGGRPSGKREPKGKETLFELATLYLKFEREPDGKGNVPAVPAATVLKSRLSHTKIEADGEVKIIPILPPRLPKATPAEIRNYIKAPPDYSKLTKDERVREEKLSDDERLMLQAQEAESRRAAAEAELVLQQEKVKEVATRAAVQQQTVPAPDQSHRAATEKAATSAGNGGTVRPAVLKQIVSFAQANGLMDHMKEVAASWGITSPVTMSADQAEELFTALKSKANEAALQVAQAKLDATSEFAPPPSVDHGHPDWKMPISQQDIAEILELAKRAKIVPAVLGELLKGAGAAKVSELSVAAAAMVKQELEARISGGSGDNGSSEADAGQQAETTTLPTGKSSAKNGEPGTVTADQLARIKKLVESVGEEGFPRRIQEAYLSKRGVQSFRSISEADADELIDKLLSVELGYKQAVGN